MSLVHSIPGGGGDIVCFTEVVVPELVRVLYEAKGENSKLSSANSILIPSKDNQMEKILNWDAR